MKSLVFLALLVATVSAKPFIGGLITGLSNLGTELGKKTTDIVKKTVDLGADALANTANVGLNTGKVAVTGMGGIGKQVLDQAGSVGHNAIGMISKQKYFLFFIITEQIFNISTTSTTFFQDSLAMVGGLETQR